MLKTIVSEFKTLSVFSDSLYRLNFFVNKELDHLSTLQIRLKYRNLYTPLILYSAD